MADKRSVVSLNLGSQRIGAAKFAVAKGGALVLKDYAFTEILGDPAADSSRIAQIEVAVSELADKLKAGKSPTHWAMAGQSVFTRFVKLPPLGNENVDKLVAFEAQQNVPFPMNEVIWDYQFVGESDAGDVEVVLVAIKADSLNEYNEAVEGAQLKTAVVDVAPLALYNAYRYNYADVATPALIIDIGARTTNLIFYDGNRAFTRNIPVGGSMITSNIAKEFRLPFNKAEDRKIESGFVALGGAYADHDDPEIAAMSKVIRNTLGRLASEIERTKSFYRTQQGGAVPEIVYLAGGCSGLPYVREFFIEKLGIPVEFFNALRNVSLGPGVDAEKAARDAHSLGELVGLALRNSGSCPMELDLVPDPVERRRDITKRKPFLILATLASFAVLGAGIAYFKRGAKIAKDRAAEVVAESAGLNKHDKDINELSKRRDEVATIFEPLREAVGDRSIWLQILSDLNTRLPGDVIWLVEIEPLSGEDSVAPALSSSSRGAAGFGGFGFDSSPAPAAKTRSEVDGSGGLVDHLKIRGLYRRNGESEQVVYRFLQQLVESPFFELDDLEERKSEIVLRVDSEVSGEPRWAYPFEFKLPLARRIKIYDEDA